MSAERVYAPTEGEPPADDAGPEETAAFLTAMLDATSMDIGAAFQAKQAGRRREVELYRGALRLTDEALAELRGHIQQLAASAEPAADGTWTGWSSPWSTYKTARKQTSRQGAQHE